MHIVQGVGDVLGGDVLALGFEGGEDNVAGAGDAGDVQGQGLARLFGRVDGVAGRVGGQQVEGGEGAGLDTGVVAHVGERVRSSRTESCG